MNTKVKLILALGILVAVSATADGQDVPELNQATVYSRMTYRDWRKPWGVNFDRAEEVSADQQLRGIDLKYGTLKINDDGDWFEVRDPRSMIVDLGAKKWGDVKETPAFFKGKKPRKPLPLNAPKLVDASANSKDISPYQQFVRVKAGHMYLMKVVTGRAKTYIIFRVDNLFKEDNCLLSWKKVPPPVDDVEK
jgi:hypothetical protein